MKVHLVYDTRGWAYHSTTTALVKYAPPDMKITHSHRLPPNLPEYDLVVILPFPRAQRFAPQCRLYGVKTVLGCYIQLPHFEAEFEASAKFADHIVFNCMLSYNHWKKNHDMSNVTYIPQGVDSDLFFNEKRPGRKDLALLCSSEHFRILKGTEIAKRCNYVDIHIADSTNHRMGPADMRALYNQYKVYCCLSEYDATPTPALEAAHCGCVVVSTPVGNMPELISHGFNGFLLSNRDPDLVDHMVWSACYNYEAMSYNMSVDIVGWDWRTRSLLFYDLFRSLCTTNPDCVLNH